MKIAGATKDHWSQVSGQAGQARDWLVFDCPPGAPLPEPRRVALTREPLPHHCQDTARTRCRASRDSHGHNEHLPA